MNAPPDPTPQPWRRDFHLAGLFLALGFGIGLIYMATTGTANFYADQHGPAVMIALGQGFFNPDPAQVPALDDFLQQRVDVLDVAALPEVIPKASSYTPMQLLYMNGQYMVGAVWAFFGISWSSLIFLFGALYGISAALVYGVFRLGMGRVLSALMSFLFITAPLHLNMLPLLRDYGKVPFMLAIILLLGTLVKYPLKRWGVLLMGALFGALCGIGLGFRDDVLMAIPAFLVTMAFFRPGGLRRSILPKPGAIGLMALCFYGCAYPVLQVRKEIGACEGDHLYLGLLDRCSERLGVGGTPYRFGGPYSDNYVKGAIHSYGHRALDFEDTPDWYTPEYDEIGTQLVRELLFTFPADFVVRAYASVLRLLDGMHPSAARPAPEGLTFPYWQRLYGLHLSLILLLGMYTRYQAVVLVVLLSGRDLRLGLFVLLLGLYFLGINAVQFNLRHHFHLGFVPLWVAGFLLQQGACLARDAWAGSSFPRMWESRTRGSHPEINLEPHLRGDNPLNSEGDREHDQKIKPEAGQGANPGRWSAKSWRKPAMRMALAASLIVFGLPVALWGLRIVQQAQVYDLLGTYQSAELEALEFRALPTDGDKIQIEVPAFANLEGVPEARRGWRLQGEMLVAEFDDHTGEIPIVLRYESEVPGIDYPGNNFTWSVSIPPSDLGNPTPAATQKIFLPIYYATWSDFLGIEISREDLAHLKGLYRWRNPEKLPPILLYAHLSGDWEEAPLYQRLLSH